jgi:hypothetical protein
MGEPKDLYPGKRANEAIASLEKRATCICSESAFVSFLTSVSSRLARRRKE